MVRVFLGVKSTTGYAAFGATVHFPCGSMFNGHLCIPFNNHRGLTVDSINAQEYLVVVHSTIPIIADWCEINLALFCEVRPRYYPRKLDS